MGGERTAVQQLHQHGGAGRFADQRGDVGDLVGVHTATLAASESPCFAPELSIAAPARRTMEAMRQALPPLKETPMETSAPPTLQPPAPRAFFGATVVRAAFVLAIFGWGIGFYSPAIF